MSIPTAQRPCPRFKALGPVLSSPASDPPSRPMDGLPPFCGIVTHRRTSARRRGRVVGLTAPSRAGGMRPRPRRSEEATRPKENPEMGRLMAKAMASATALQGAELQPRPFGRRIAGPVSSKTVSEKTVS